MDKLLFEYKIDSSGETMTVNGLSSQEAFGASIRPINLIYNSLKKQNSECAEDFNRMVIMAFLAPDSPIFKESTFSGYYSSIDVCVVTQKPGADGGKKGEK